MKRTIRCVYCSYWQSSPVLKILNQQEDETKKKKKKKKYIEESRTCQLNSRQIKGSTEACTYFKPRLYFYCYPSRYWLSLYQCLNRRRNRVYYYKKGIKTEKDKKYLYPNCTVRCSQFREDILPICDKLNINRLGNIRRPKPRKIKRRPRTIKRRIKKRVIKRR